MAEQNHFSLFQIGESLPSASAEPSLPQLLNQSPGYEKAVQNLVNLSEDVANNMFNPFGLVPKLSTISAKFSEVNEDMRDQPAPENLPLVTYLTSKSVNITNEYDVSVDGPEYSIFRKLKSKCEDMPSFLEEVDGYCYEKFDVDYKMSRDFAEKTSFEVFRCAFCLARNRFPHKTNTCRVLSIAQKCHQMATGIFCFKCLAPNHRTKNCKKFQKGCCKCQSANHSRWTHNFISKLQSLWGISTQEEALQKRRTEGADWCDRHFPSQYI